MDKANFDTITIIGVGLIGGSIGLAIRNKKLASRVIGVGRNQSSITEAKQRGAIDVATLDIKRGVGKSDLVIIATPVNKVIEIAREVVKHLPPGAILTDVASTKTDIVTKIEGFAPSYIHYVGTHPMAGSEKKGIKFASPSMFNNTNCIITVSIDTHKKALSKIKKFWERLGSKVLVMSPDLHDKVVATVSHIPHLVATCLVRNGEDFLSSAGGSFKDVTRVALSNPEMWSYIFVQNKKNILKNIDKIIWDLKQLSNLIVNDNEQELRNILEEVRSKREKLNEA